MAPVPLGLSASNEMTPGLGGSGLGSAVAGDGPTVSWNVPTIRTTATIDAPRERIRRPPQT